MLFKPIQDADLHVAVYELADQAKNDQRFVIVTDFKTLLAIDTKTQDTLETPLVELVKHFDFFLPWAGGEKANYQNENRADVRAAERMAKLFDEIKVDNPDNSPEFIHSLNVFLSRMLFCFFAEDTGIFEDNQFTNAIGSHTQEDGSDLSSYLDTLFEVLNTPNAARKDLPAYLDAFPYVNGGLFNKQLKAPNFTRKSREAFLASGKLDWSEINPDIFGSMIQAVISPEHRGGLGMHYTSVPNIMKVIEPLFLDDLKEAFEKAKGSPKRLTDLVNRLGKIKIFDPACGSGNFLIIAYKELRRLEMDVFQELGGLELSRVKLSQFYGIEIDDFAHEIAQLSLWLAEHQMNMEFLDVFGRTNPTLPLREAGHIVNANACRIEWQEVCPKNDNDEIYILGNPPYLGARMQNKEQKQDLEIVYQKYGKAKKIDYIVCWFLKASEYTYKSHVYFSFVTTNSICQGEQVSLLWKHILELDLEIFFAYHSFKWQNQAKGNAGVSVAIIGVRNISKQAKTIYTKGRKVNVSNINPYLVDAENIFIERRSSALGFPCEMEYGNMAIDGGHLILSVAEKNNLLDSNPNTKKIIRRIFGAQEFLNDKERYCLWIKDEQLSEISDIPELRDRINRVREKRFASNDKGTQILAHKPHQFREMKEAHSIALIVPTVSSERRNYIPISFIDKKSVIIAPNQAIYDPEIWIFSVISSRMHMSWVRSVAGRLKTDYRYASSLCYNTFPFLNIVDAQKQNLTNYVFNIIEEREKYSEKTLA